MYSVCANGTLSRIKRLARSPFANRFFVLRKECQSEGGERRCIFVCGMRQAHQHTYTADCHILNQATSRGCIECETNSNGIDSFTLTSSNIIWKKRMNFDSIAATSIEFNMAKCMSLTLSRSLNEAFKRGLPLVESLVAALQSSLVSSRHDLCEPFYVRQVIGRPCSGVCNCWTHTYSHIQIQIFAIRAQWMLVLSSRNNATDVKYNRV